MNVIVILIMVSLGLATSFLLAFVWAVRNGQFDDTQTPSVRLLLDESPADTSRCPRPNNQKPTEHERRDIQVR
jgi:cbb3-type cytochrome oxidase maturation protein